MLDEKKMLQMIASEPLIRTVVLADQLDCDIQDVEDALLPMINRGRVIAQSVMAPNNRRATGYTLSNESRSEILRASSGVAIDTGASRADLAIEFIKEHDTVTGAQLHAFMGLTPEEAPSQFLAEALADGRLFKDGKFWTLGAASRCAPVPQPQVGLKVSRALAFIADNGSATDSQLRKVMDIGKDVPATYLAEEVKAGKVHKSSWHWRAGPAPAGAVKASFRISDEKGPVAQFGPTVQPEEVKDLPKELVSELSKPVQEVVASARALEPEPAPEQEPEAKPSFPTTTFRCGLWSDGLLELQRDGKVIAALSPDEIAQVSEFLKKAA